MHATVGMVCGKRTFRVRMSNDFKYKSVKIIKEKRLEREG